MSAATYYKSFFSLQILFCKYHTLIQVAYAKYLNRFHFMFLNLIFHKFKTFALNIWFSEMRGPVWDFQTTSKDCRKIGLGNGGIQLNLLKLTLILNNRWQLFKYSTKTPVCAPPSSILPGQVFSSDFSFLLPQTHSTLSLPTQNRQKKFAWGINENSVYYHIYDQQTPYNISFKANIDRVNLFLFLWRAPT